MPRSFVGAETKAPVIKELIGVTDDFHGSQLWHDFLRLSREEYLRHGFDVRQTWKQCPLALRDCSRDNLMRTFASTPPFSAIHALARHDVVDWGLRQSHYRARESYRRALGAVRRRSSETNSSATAAVAAAALRSSSADPTPVPAVYHNNLSRTRTKVEAEDDDDDDDDDDSDHESGQHYPSRRRTPPPGSFDPITNRYYPR